MGPEFDEDNDGEDDDNLMDSPVPANDEREASAGLDLDLLDYVGDINYWNLKDEDIVMEDDEDL
jgi:hypothetical protein